MSPNVEGLSAISAWMFTCILFVFGALIEYAGILYKMKKSQKGTVVDRIPRKVHRNVFSLKILRK